MELERTTRGSMATGDRVERVIRYAAERWSERPSLDDLAAVAGLSRFHFDRVFRAWVGLPPLRFVQMLTLAEGKQFLGAGRSLLETSMELGLSGPSRLHDLFVTIDAVTPGNFKARGRGLSIGWGIHPTPFGRCLVGLSPRGVCFLTFEDGERDALHKLRQTWPEADLRADAEGSGRVVRRVFGPRGHGSRRIAVHVRGTNFQTKVWAALLAIPAGAVASYGDVARSIGSPRATRAVGSACGANPVGVLIPCHRVIRESGALGHYGFGVPRKRALLAWEIGRRNPDA